MSIAVDVLLGVVFLVLFVALVAVLVYFIMDRRGFVWWWERGKKGAIKERYPCIESRECGSLYGLGANYICDPHLKQCRIRAYRSGTCQSGDDCMQATPSCILGVIGQGSMCAHPPYQEGGLYGDPSLQEVCRPGFGPNPVWNFCQAILGSACLSTDDCLSGVCKNGVCTYLEPFAVCTEGSNYATDQCQDPNVCTPDTKIPIDPYRCMPPGIAQHAEGAFCVQDSDCDNKDCYRINPTDPVGQCGNRQALIGMPCRGGHDCAKGLDCNLKTIGGVVSGTCILTDVTTVTEVDHCPAQYTQLALGNLGCAGAINPVPCSDDLTCISGGCAIGSVESLVLGVLLADQTWQRIYPLRSRLDTNLIFSNAFTMLGGRQAVLNPGYTIVMSPYMPIASLRHQYPTIKLGLEVSGATAPPVTEPKACTPLVGGLELYSTFANTSSDTITFVVNYNPLTAVTSTVGVLISSPLLNVGETIYISMPSIDLFTYYLSDQQPPTAPTAIFVYANYAGPTDPRPWTLSAGEQLHRPTDWLGFTPTILPEPRYRAKTGDSTYLSNSLRFDAGTEPELFAHFFFFPSPGERVVSSRFRTLPSQVGGGVTTLVGLYDVESPTNRRIVISTLAVYAQTSTDELESREYATNDTNGTVYAVRKSWFTDSATGKSIFTSCYSFTLVDFGRNWPFQLLLLGPASTQHDTAGLCSVEFTSPSNGTASSKTLSPDGGIPGWNGKYPVFTPRAYTRVQAQSMIRNDEWTSLNLFGTVNPTLLDSDIIIMASAGSHNIAGILLVLSQQDTAETQTLLMTLRFGDTLPGSLYSKSNLIADALKFIHPTKMFTFYLTPEPVETGGGSLFVEQGGQVIIYSPAFPLPQVALAPRQSPDITSWATPPYPYVDITGRQQYLFDGTGQYTSHSTRTPWGIEVFTASLVPEILMPPVRFFRMPAALPDKPTDPYGLSAQGGDDIWIWGRDIDDSSTLVCVPLFFDNLGTLHATATVGWTPDQKAQTWLSVSATSCPPASIDEIFLGLDHTYYPNPPDGTSYTPTQWGVTPTAMIRNQLRAVDGVPVDPPFIADPLPLIGRMCETQGYQDGILYRARPYAYWGNSYEQQPSAQDMALPVAVRVLLSQTGDIVPIDLQSMAVVLSSKSGVLPDYRDTISRIGVGAIEAMVGPAAKTPAGSVHPRLVGFFAPESPVNNLFWASSEGGTTPILPGGYRTLPCPGNPRAVPISQAAGYPYQCRDAVLAVEIQQRKPLPIVMVYRKSVGSPNERVVYETRLYDIRMIRSKTAGYSVNVISDTIVQMNGGLAVMETGYPGFNGGPAMIYTPCLGSGP